ncbi:MAG: hypothetical protein VB111_07100 [Clostridiaceae bacterium]|nr:hypothetical protein [Clostridiaceae bacterium]
MPHPTEVLFFFDTEDFTSNRSADAILELARICTEEGVRGHFALVGLLAFQLQAWGRRDVLDALSPHEVGTHTYGHSLHPDICEQTDFESFDQSYLTAAKSECEALGLIRGVTGHRELLFAVPPGDSKSYAAMYLYANLGIPFYCDTVVTDDKNRDLYYCNLRQIAYTRAVEEIFCADTPPDLDAILDDFAAQERVIVYTHPNMAYFSQFWDGVNYHGENRHPWGEWEPCKPRDPAQTRAYFNGFRTLIRRIRADERFRITDLPALRASEPPRRPVTPGDIPVLYDALRRALAPVTVPQSLSVADIFLACVTFLGGSTEYLPAHVYGFLSAPVGISEPVTVTADALRAAARYMDVSRFLPERIPVGDTSLGPADFLYAALDVLSRGADSVTLQPCPQLNSLAAFPSLERFSLRGTWVHTAALRDDYLSDRLRLQAWTLRYGAVSCR